MHHAQPSFQANQEPSDSQPNEQENPNPTPSQTKEEADELRKQLGLQTETGSVTTDNGRNVIHCLTIIGQIEGHYTLPDTNKTTKYEHVIPQLVAIEESLDIDGLLILLNTVGGDIEAGLAIAELIAGMKKPTVSLVLGGGHSIGVPLAIAAKRSFIARTATMTLHPVRMNGLVLGIPQTFSYFERMQERITGFVANNSHMKPERYTELCMNTHELVMDVGSVLDGDKAVKEGLIDECGSLSDAIASLYAMIDKQKESVGSVNEKGQATP
jgi:ATP-dependent protease ClpP protease subunit